MIELTLHFAPFSCALISLIALEETGHPFAVEPVALMAGAHRRPDYLALNPAGKVPVLVVDGRPLTETLAILVWLSGRFPEGKLLPDLGDFRGRTEVLSDLALCAATLQPFAARIRLPHRYCAAEPNRVRTQAIEQLCPQLDWIEARLASRKGGWWYGVDWSVVDAHLGWVWTAVSQEPGVDTDAYPNLVRHSAAGLARPAVQRALARQAEIMAALGPPDLLQPT